MTRPGATRRARTRNRWIIVIGIAALTYFAFAQADGTLPISGFQLADEYSRTDFYSPQEQ